MKKGSKVYIEGRLQTRSWDKDGGTRYTTAVIASDVAMLGGTEGPEKPAATRPTAAPNLHGVPITDEDIPF